MLMMAPSSRSTLLAITTAVARATGVAGAAAPVTQADLTARMESATSDDIEHRLPWQDTRANPSRCLGAKEMTLTSRSAVAWQPVHGTPASRVPALRSKLTVSLALLNAVREIVDNGVDHILRCIKTGAVDSDGMWVMPDGGRMRPRLDITIDAVTGDVVVHNNGRGFELKMVSQTGLCTVTSCFDILDTSGNYKHKNHVIGCHGDGAKYANHVSARFKVETLGDLVDGTRAFFTQSWVDHKPLPYTLAPEAAAPRGFTGTRVSFTPDLEVSAVQPVVRLPRPPLTHLLH